MANKNVSVTYYQTLKDVFWPLRPEKWKIKYECQKKMEKFASFVKKKAKIHVKNIDTLPLPLETMQ